MSLLVTPERAAELKAGAKDIPVYDLSPGQTDWLELLMQGAVGEKNLNRVFSGLPEEPKLALRDAEGVILAIVDQSTSSGLEGLEIPTRYDSLEFRFSPSDTPPFGGENVGVFFRSGVDGAMVSEVQEWLSGGEKRSVTLFLPASTTESGDFPHLPLQGELCKVLEEFSGHNVRLIVVPFPGDLPESGWLPLEEEIIEKFGCTSAPGNWSAFREAGKVSSGAADPSVAGFTVFFTGLSGSGKSTVARHLQVKLLERGCRSVSLLDGDLVRQHLSSELGFSKEHRDINIRRIGYVASEVTKHGGAAVCCPIAPYNSTRQAVRAMIEPLGGFVLVHISTPVEVCEARDRKGLYAKARAGIIKEFTGISDPYETPEDADLSINTEEVSAADAADRVIELLEERGYFSEA